jgi:hypothetical protein
MGIACDETVAVFKLPFSYVTSPPFSSLCLPCPTLRLLPLLPEIPRAPFVLCVLPLSVLGVLLGSWSGQEPLQVVNILPLTDKKLRTYRQVILHLEYRVHNDLQVAFFNISLSYFANILGGAVLDMGFRLGLLPKVLGQRSVLGPVLGRP